MDDESYNNKFSGEQTVHFGSAALTLPMLERVIEIANKHGKVAIIGIAPSSMTALLLELIDSADKMREASGRCCPLCGVKLLPQIFKEAFNCYSCGTRFVVGKIGVPEVSNATR